MLVLTSHMASRCIQACSVTRRRPGWARECRRWRSARAEEFQAHATNEIALSRLDNVAPAGLGFGFGNNHAGWRCGVKQGLLFEKRRKNVCSLGGAQGRPARANRKRSFGSLLQKRTASCLAYAADGGLTRRKNDCAGHGLERNVNVGAIPPPLSGASAQCPSLHAITVHLRPLFLSRRRRCAATARRMCRRRAMAGRACRRLLPSNESCYWLLRALAGGAPTRCADLVARGAGWDLY